MLPIVAPTPDIQAPEQPLTVQLGHHKLLLRGLQGVGFPRNSRIVIGWVDRDEMPVVVRLLVHGRQRASVDAPGPMFYANGGARVFRRGRLLAFWTGSGDTMFVDFVRLEPRTSRLRFVQQFEYPTVHSFERTGRLDEHVRFWQDDQPGGRSHSPQGLFTQHWRWSPSLGRFVKRGHSFLASWNGWDDTTLR